MIQRSELKKKAKAALKPKHWIAVGTDWLAGATAGSVATAGFGLGIIFAPALDFGLKSFYKELVATKEAKFEKLFTDTLSGFWKKLGTAWVVVLYTFLWRLLFVIPGIVKSYSYAMTYYIMLDHPEMKINQAITESRRMMNGYKWKLFVLDLSFIGWRLLGLIVPLGLLNILYVNPYIAATKAAFYEELKNESYATVEE